FLTRNGIPFQWVDVDNDPLVELLGGRDEHGVLLTGHDVVTDSRDTWWKLSRDPYPLESSQPGVFVAGDLRRGSTKRVASAVGEGAMAASLIHRYLALDHGRTT